MKINKKALVIGTSTLTLGMPPRLEVAGAYGGPGEAILYDIGD